jgi:hypothetical protein
LKKKAVIVETHVAELARHFNIAVAQLQKVRGLFVLRLDNNGRVEVE